MANNKKKFLNKVLELFGADYVAQANEKVSEENFKSHEDWDEWVEADFGQPGDLESSPCLVWCRLSHEAGSVTARSYEYLSGINWSIPKSA